MLHKLLCLSTVEGATVEPTAAFALLQLGFVDQTPWRCELIQVIRLYYQGWAKVSIMHVLQVSRPTVNAWIRRFEAEHFAGLVDKLRGPKHPRKVWLPLIVPVYHLQKAHPDAGECRLWSLLAQPEVAVRTVGRIMALNRLVSDDIPHVLRRDLKTRPGPHPDKATVRHQYWFIDGRRLDVAIDGVKWWRRILTSGGASTTIRSPWPARRRNSSSSIRPSSRRTTPRRTRGGCAISGVPRIPVDVLGAVKGRVYPKNELARACSQGLFPRTMKRHGCVTLHSDHFSLEEGLPHTRGLLWVAGESLRAAFEHVIVAEYRCRYDWQDRKVNDIQGGVFYPTRFAARKGP